MNETLATTRTPEIIAAEVKAYSISMLTNVLEIGRRFKEAKSLLPHGEFGTWLKEQCGYSKSTASNFMRLFEEYGERQSSLFGTGVEVQTFGNLGYSQALALLALPAEEREKFVESHDLENTSIRQLKAEIEEWKHQAEKSDEDFIKAVEERDAANERADELEKRVKELKSRPVDVAVAEPDPAVIEEAVSKALAEVETTHDKAMRAMKKIVDDAEEKVKKAEAAKTEAEKATEKAESQRNAEAARAEEAERRAADAEKNAGSEAEKLKVELEQAKAEAARLEKQLAMSGENMTLFKERFFAWQTDWGKMREALIKLDGETADKSKQAVIAQLKRWLGELGIRVE